MIVDEMIVEEMIGHRGEDRPILIQQDLK